MAGPYYARAAAPTPGSGTYRGLYVASTMWAIGDIIVPSLAYATAAAKGYIYRCTTAGTGSGTEPTWVFTTPGTSTTTDGAVWTVENATTWAYATPRPDYIANNKLAAGETLYAENVSYPLTASTTITIPGTSASPCILISTSDTTNAPPTSIADGAHFNASAQTSAINLSINGKAFISGFSITPSSSTGDGRIYLAQTDDSMIALESCSLLITNTNSTGGLYIGNIGSNARFITENCTLKLGNNASQKISTANRWSSVGDTFQITTTQPTAYFNIGAGNAASIIDIEGGDLSVITSTLVAGSTTMASTITLYGCKLGSGVAILAAQTGPAHAEAWVVDCSSGDTHYEFAHYNYWGNTTVSAAIYLNTANGAAYNVAGSKYSWRVESVNGTFQTPYVSPWIDVYNEATAAVTPRLEVLRDGSTTAYNDNQVWAEFRYKGTSGFTTLSCVNDRCGLVATAAAQGSSSMGASDWVGETAPWYGKLEPSSTITPAEIGAMGARVCVAGANVVYVNPKLLGV